MWKDQLEEASAAADNDKHGLEASYRTLAGSADIAFQRVQTWLFPVPRLRDGRREKAGASTDSRRPSRRSVPFAMTSVAAQQEIQDARLWSIDGGFMCQNLVTKALAELEILPTASGKTVCVDVAIHASASQGRRPIADADEFLT